MKICDRCEKQVDHVYPLAKEFSGGGLEVCNNCDDLLYKQLDAVDKELAEIKARRRKVVFRQWWNKELPPQQPKGWRVRLTDWLWGALKPFS